MNNINLNKNHTLFIFALSIFFYFSNLKLDLEILHIICFFLIATIGVSHGALDNQKGRLLLKGGKHPKKTYRFLWKTYRWPCEGLHMAL